MNLSQLSSKDPNSPAFDPSDNGQVDADEKVENAEIAEKVRECLMSLSEIDREVLELKLFDGLSDIEIAIRLRIKPGTARVRLHRALEHLIDKMRQNGYFEFNEIEVTKVDTSAIETPYLIFDLFRKGNKRLVVAVGVSAIGHRRLLQLLLSSKLNFEKELREFAKDLLNGKAIELVVAGQECAARVKEHVESDRFQLCSDSFSNLVGKIVCNTPGDIREILKKADKLNSIAAAKNFVIEHLKMSSAAKPKVKPPEFEQHEIKDSVSANVDLKVLLDQTLNYMNKSNAPRNKIRTSRIVLDGERREIRKLMDEDSPEEKCRKYLESAFGNR